MAFLFWVKVIRGDNVIDLNIDGAYDIRSVRGGDVNEAFKVYTDKGPYFLLLQRGRDNNFFQAEIVGLKLFEENGVNAPRVLDSGVSDDGAYLLLDYIEEGRWLDQGDLARELKKVHQIASPNGKFGFDFAYRGSSISFSNAFKDTWREVFLEERMDKLKDKLIEGKIWSSEDLATYENVRKVIDVYLKRRESEPVLLHGDLWPGNAMFSVDGKAYIFDPAPLYGDWEFDIGVSTVFSGFDDNFYRTYLKDIGKDSERAIRLEFYRLYLLMVHLHKFGNMYRSSVDLSMDKILSKSLEK